MICKPIKDLQKLLNNLPQTLLRTFSLFGANLTDYPAAVCLCSHWLSENRNLNQSGGGKIQQVRIRWSLNQTVIQPYKAFGVLNIIITKTYLGVPPVSKSAVFLNIVQKGGGHFHVQKFWSKFCMILKAFWQHKIEIERLFKGRNVSNWG